MEAKERPRTSEEKSDGREDGGEEVDEELGDLPRLANKLERLRWGTAKWQRLRRGAERWSGTISREWKRKASLWREPETRKVIESVGDATNATRRAKVIEKCKMLEEE